MDRRRSLTAALVLLSFAVASCSGDAGSGKAPSATSTSASASASSPAPVSSSRSATRPKPKPRPKSTTTTHRPSPSATKQSTTKPAKHPAAPVKHRLPLDYTTGNANQVITVTASSSSSTTATLQSWRRVSGGWRTVGPAVSAHLGSAGLGHAQESSSKTPSGSFTLTQAFGHDSDPGTSLPYVHTTSSDWWISQPGPLYNTRQRCSSGCSFTRGDPNEHLFYETPYYNYAVVIDYNTRNAPGGVTQGAGSAFFLHVTDGNPTAGCVSIAQDQLVRLLRWLDPAERPRILIGIG
jgi:L,D-peptidoglycan transpeptidase YkuD (ErfK/YbiS/YcfS/YnhG family)/predicted small secreted protein